MNNPELFQEALDLGVALTKLETHYFLLDNPGSLHDRKIKNLNSQIGNYLKCVNWRFNKLEYYYLRELRERSIEEIRGYQEMTEDSIKERQKHESEDQSYRNYYIKMSVSCIKRINELKSKIDEDSEMEGRLNHFRTLCYYFMPATDYMLLAP